MNENIGAFLIFILQTSSQKCLPYDPSRWIYGIKRVNMNALDELIDLNFCSFEFLSRTNSLIALLKNIWELDTFSKKIFNKFEFLHIHTHSWLSTEIICFSMSSELWFEQ
ncbi:hypothetical protein BpHYR1_050987 [Brachionus plicatilis]|uniref:Uncharacterized protein n=1 Tax=Brachionus plicatilis TaxID=10195 RepID=A0A3M7QYG2_BRAPC|nr:hypothetical protein BpHYR1_050987 [Brachionus plicatilis]